VDFNELIDRRGTYSLKWDNPKNVPGLPDIIPLWVADMDFAPPEAVLQAIRARAEHPIFGYTRAAFEYNEAVAAWYAARQGFELPPEHILMGPSVMPALAAILHGFTEKGDAVMIMPPVYHPFFGMPEENGRVVVTSPLARSPEGSWSMDFGAMEKAAREAQASGARLRAIIVSSPHNPVGRVWSEAELLSLLAFARDRGLTLICDEIHSDIILGERKFFSMAALSGEKAKGLIVLSGPNKTFNIAGLHLCQVIAREEKTREKAKKAISAWGFDEPNVFSLAAATAAYRAGGPWLDELLAYLRGNHRFLLEFLSKRLPEVGVSELEGSYLAWLDLRELLKKRGEGMDERGLAKRLEEEGRVKLSPGSIFGKEGEGYLRLNLACPKSLLAEGLERMARTIEKA
jgi:cysteine-S-conjugate beta-lyase